jgi:hypothetical protein
METEAFQLEKQLKKKKSASGSSDRQQDMAKGMSDIAKGTNKLFNQRLVEG